MFPQTADKSNALKAITWFTISTIITWLFIIKFPMYISLQQQLLSCSIAGAKWSIQILSALLFLKNNKWLFLERIGFTCLVGSVILLPFYISSVLNINNSPTFFFGSLIAAVLVMIALYYRGVKQAGVGIQWWLAWLGCLAIAISLQLTVVFHIL